MSTIIRSDINAIRDRWKSEKKISADAIEKLLSAAYTGLTLQSANEMRTAGRKPDGGLSDLLGGMFK